MFKSKKTNDKDDSAKGKSKGKDKKAAKGSNPFKNALASAKK